MILKGGFKKLGKRLIKKRNYSTNNEKQDFDIVIVGGGLIGSALACALGSYLN